VIPDSEPVLTLLRVILALPPALNGSRSQQAQVDRPFESLRA
jgi:hypothetical protein